MSKGQLELMLVDDNPADIELMLHVLKKHNLANRVVIARDGAEALDFLLGSGRHADGAYPSVVLLDLKMPRGSGFDVLERMRSDPRTRTIPVVILTSSEENTDVKKAYEMGANSYIVKPVDFAQFTEIARQIGAYWLLLNRQPE